MRVFRRLLLVVLVPAAVLFVGVSVTGATPPPTRQWSDYLIARVGRECSYSSLATSFAPAGAARATRRVVSARKTSAGLAVGLQTTITATGALSLTGRNISTNTVTYLLAPNGTVEVVPESAVINNLRYTIRGAELYPTVPELIRGAVQTSTFTLTITPGDLAGQEAFRSFAIAGATAVRLSVDIAVRGVDAGLRIVTPAGRFVVSFGTNVVVSVRSIQNVKPADAAPLRLVVNSAYNETTDYVAGVGIVSQRNNGVTTQLQKCSG